MIIWLIRYKKEKVLVEDYFSPHFHDEVIEFFGCLLEFGEFLFCSIIPFCAVFFLY
jgi:hypothetical protein